MRNWSRFTVNIGKKVNVTDPSGERISGRLYGTISDYDMLGNYVVQIDGPLGENYIENFPVEWCEIIENEAPSEQNQTEEDAVVNHPSHYTDGGIETIDFIEHFWPNSDFHMANAVKYISRAGKKKRIPEREDIKKAIWYLKRKLKDRQTIEDKMGVPNHGSYIDQYIDEKKLNGTLKALALRMICKYGALEEAVLFLEMYLDTDNGEYPDLKRRFQNENHSAQL